MTAQPTYKVYTDLSLMLDKFIACITEQRFEVLIIEGEPSQADLLEAWSNIYALYLDAIGDNDTVYALTMQREIAVLQGKITAVECIVAVLSKHHFDVLIPLLKNFGFDTKGLTPDNSKYLQELTRINARMASWKLQLQQKSEELQTFMKMQEGGQDGQASYTEFLSVLSKFMGFAVRAHDTTVAEFCAHFKLYFKHSKSRTQWPEEEK